MSIEQNSIDPVLIDLFCVELEAQAKILYQGLIEIEKKQKDEKLLESLMRAAHSVKGAARVVNILPIVRLAHLMEDCFEISRKEQKEIPVERVDQLLKSIDFLVSLSKVNVKEIAEWLNQQASLVESLMEMLGKPPEYRPPSTSQTVNLPPKEPESQGLTKVQAKDLELEKKEKKSEKKFEKSPTLRISAENLTRLMGLAGESLVESHLLDPFADHLQEFKIQLNDIEKCVGFFKKNIKEKDLSEIAKHYLTTFHRQINLLFNQLNQCIMKFDDYIRRHVHLSDQLYQEVITSRMRNFADGVEGLPRVVRDLGRELGKQVKLEISGESTLVDREILELLESPLNHLLRNAIDHGIEFPEERLAAGKSAEGTIKIDAHHYRGRLAINVSDDGKGVDLESLRNKIVEKNLVSTEMSKQLSESELIEFLFLPGFSTSGKLTEISGRGIGLNVVKDTLHKLGGSIRVHSSLGKGISFHLQLPLTLSVIRALIVEISNNFYAFPLVHIDHALHIASNQIQEEDDQIFFDNGEEKISIVHAWKILELEDPQHSSDQLSVVILSEQLKSFGVIVDRFVGEKELVIQECDRQLRKIPNISSGAVMEDGALVLIIDVEDIIQSIAHFISKGSLMDSFKDALSHPLRKKILVVDDSSTVREVESQLLSKQGYDVETAVNGVDGWNALRTKTYDMVITDIDMPRMNGIELLKAIKNDPHLQQIPVMIVSYKEGEEEKRKGLEAGAANYLTKSSFPDGTFIKAVKKILGGTE